MQAAQIRALQDRVIAGDAEALAVLIEHYLPGLRAFIRLRMGPGLRARESSSDLAQSVCREILQHEQRFKHPNETAFKSWLYKTAVRKIADRVAYYRTQKRELGREEAHRDAGAVPVWDMLRPVYESFSSPSQRLMRQEDLERIERAFDELSDEHREVISLAYVVGSSHAEIALQMNRTEGATRVLLHRALARLAGTVRAAESQAPD